MLALLLGAWYYCRGDRYGLAGNALASFGTTWASWKLTLVFLLQKVRDAARERNKVFGRYGHRQ